MTRHFKCGRCGVVMHVTWFVSRCLACWSTDVTEEKS